ncbi:nucleoside kinase [bacterium]|nr:nucleoside kinase [bacterium]
MPPAPNILSAQPRTTVQVTFPDGRVLEASKGATLEAFVRVHSGEQFRAVAAVVNNDLCELTHAPESDVSVTPLTLDSSDGVRIYRRALAFLLVTAVEELYPRHAVQVDYSVPFGGFFCQMMDCPQLSSADLKRIEDHMHAMVAEDIPIERLRMPIHDARRIFADRRERDKEGLLGRRGKEYLMMYRLRRRIDAFYGYMVPSTGYLNAFAIVPREDGFILQYPRQQDPMTMTPPYPSPTLDAIFREYGELLRKLKIESIAQINDAILAGRVREVILVSEALHEQRIAHIAGQIAALRGTVRLVLTAGPSSSGKTTFSKRLAIQLLAQGVRPFTLELDRFFLEREQTPRDEHGNFDFEALEALDLGLLNSCVNDLVNGKTVKLPTFNFKSGTRERGPSVRLRDDQVIIAEGIHGLNPRLLPSVPKDRTFRIYISALTQLNIDRHNRVPTTDTRLIRRIVRDAAHRGWTADDTLNMWESVRRGEKRNIFPFQENADAMFNSALVYELAVLKPIAHPLLLQVKPSSPRYIAAKRLLAFLNLIEGIKADMVPDNSLLREFVGGSILDDYLP